MAIDSFFKDINKVASSAKGIYGQVKSAYSEIQGVVSQAKNVHDTALTVIEDPKNAIKSVIGGSFLGDQFNIFDGGGSSAVAESAAGSSNDMRVRLRAMQPKQVYGPEDRSSNILAILYETNGVLFPYTPTIQWSQVVDYSSTSLTHTNQDFQVYKSTPSTTISVMGEFSVQNQREGEYLLAVIHFLRTVSKMHFGKQSQQRGMPPPVLVFSGYGDYMFNDLPVVLKDHAYSLGKDVHYIDVEVGGGKIRLPTLLTISMSLVIQQTPKKLREDFNLEEFRTGKLMKSKGWI